MKKIKNFIYGAALYTVCLLTVFYIFALISTSGEAVMEISKYFTILFFGCLISVSALIFDTKINFILKYIINYSVLLTAFCIIFLSSDTGTSNMVARTFAAIFIFSLLYALVLVLRYLFVIIWKSENKKRGKKK